MTKKKFLHVFYSDGLPALILIKHDLLKGKHNLESLEGGLDSLKTISLQKFEVLHKEPRAYWPGK